MVDPSNNDVTDEVLKIIERDTKFPVGSKMWVNVTHFDNPKQIFIRPSSLDCYMPQIEACGEGLQPATLQLFLAVMFKPKKKKKYVRGKVVALQGTGIDTRASVHAIDYGYIEKNVSLRRLCQIANPRNHEIQPLAVACELQNCIPNVDTNPKKVAETFKFLVGHESVWVTVVDRSCDRLVIQLHNYTCPDDLALMMAYCGVSHLGYAHNTVSRISVPASSAPEHLYFTHNTFSVGDKIHVRVQSGKDLNGFYVALKNDHNIYLKERPNIRQYYFNASPMTIDEVQIGTPVVVWSMREKHERAIIKNILGLERVRVQLVDLGTIHDSPLALIKPLKSYLNHPATAIFCSVGRDYLSHPIARLLVGQEFDMIVVKTGNQFDEPYQMSVV